jgi:hypothetical protein
MQCSEYVSLHTPRITGGAPAAKSYAHRSPILVARPTTEASSGTYSAQPSKGSSQLPSFLYVPLQVSKEKVPFLTMETHMCVPSAKYTETHTISCPPLENT